MAEKYWLRLDHEGLGMPLPAVYVPTGHLPPRWPLEQHFVDVLNHDENADLPIVAGLAADIADPAGMQLLAVETAASGAQRHAAVVDACSVTAVATGRYTEPSTRDWREQAYAGRLLIVVLGHLLVQASTTPLELLFTPGSRMGVVALVANQVP
ncbi:hypothetical protein [Micromonospora sp. NPDC051141]|uniref:hypothetical protein n=1 Tax=Micromonospora sp. NPDC051141 TaxID=3364284 RepID=UPI0037A401AD